MIILNDNHSLVSLANNKSIIIVLWFWCMMYHMQSRKMPQVLQVLENIEICIFQIFEFSGRQKWRALSESDRRSVMVMEKYMLRLLIKSILWWRSPIGLKYKLWRLQLHFETFFLFTLICWMHVKFIWACALKDPIYIGAIRTLCWKTIGKWIHVEVCLFSNTASVPYIHLLW